MYRGPDPLRLIIVVAVLAIIGVQVNSWLRKQSPTRVPFASGSATISGHVVDEDGQPILNAVVVAQSYIPVRSGGTAATDAAGRFSIRELAAGEFQIEAKTGGYLRATFGEVSPDEGATPVVLADDSSASDVVIRMWRPASLSGRLLDRSGQPTTGCRVAAVNRAEREFTARDFGMERPRLMDARKSTSPNPSGAFELTGLVPGSYVLGVTCQGSRFVRAYFPSATTWADAEPIDLEPGSHRDKLAIRMPPASPTTMVQGVVVGPDGEPLAAQIGLSSQRGSLRTSSDANGRFTFNAIQPDRYWINAESLAKSGNVWAESQLAVKSPEPASLNLRLLPGATVRANLTYEKLHDTAMPERTWVSVEPVDRRAARWLIPGGFSNKTPGTLGGSYVIKDVPRGRYLIRIAVESIPAWRVESLLCRDRDCLDRVIEIDSTTELVVQGHLLDDAAVLTGRVARSATEEPAPWVVVFADDADLRESSRRRQFSRAHSGGRYAVTGLPAGAYRVAAVRTLTLEDWQSPGFLDRLAPEATLVQIGRAERKSLDLTAITAIPAAGR